MLVNHCTEGEIVFRVGEWDEPYFCLRADKESGAPVDVMNYAGETFSDAKDYAWWGSCVIVNASKWIEMTRSLDRRQIIDRAVIKFPDCIRRAEMPAEDLEFNISDIVITSDGYVGYIESICKCAACRDRGFYEPQVTYYGLGGTFDMPITSYDRQTGYQYYYRIGKHFFGNTTAAVMRAEAEEHESIASDLRARVNFLERLPDKED